MILSDGKDYTLQAVDNGDGGVEYRYVPTATAPEAINPNSLESVLKAMTGQTVAEWTQAQANKKDPGWGAFARETLSQPAFTIPAAFLTAGAAGAFGEGGVAGLADGVGGYSLGGSSIPAGTTIAGDATNAITPQFLGATSESTAGPMLEAGLQPSGAMTYPVAAPGAVSGYPIPAMTLAGASGGPLGNAAATGAAGAAGTAALGRASSNDTPGEATIAPGVVTPGTEPGTDQSGVGSGLGGGATNAAVSGGSAAALQRILAGNGTAADYASVLGAAAPGVIGAVASNQQTQAFKDLAEKNMAAGAPSRARYEASMTPGFDPTTIPGYSGAVDSAMQAMLRKLSTSGNPFGQPGALIEANKAIISGTALPAIRDYQSLNSSSGGLSTTAPAANTNSTNAITSSGNTWNSLGAAASNVTSPAFSLSDYFKNLTGGNNYALI